VPVRAVRNEELAEVRLVVNCEIQRRHARRNPLSQPKRTEQKPKPSDLTADRNLSLDMILPRRTPSASMPLISDAS
jgi:hypothetical protein